MSSAIKTGAPFALARRWYRNPADERIAAAVYGAIVAHARAPAFYVEFSVPDTVAGRFEMVVMHLALVIDRLGQGGEAGQRLGQRIFDAFCGDMDNSLRELGIGDLAVPKQMKRIVARFYGRSEAYRQGLATGEETLAAVLARNVPAADAALARYMLAAAADLAEESASLLAGAAPHFPDPALFVRARVVS